MEYRKIATGMIEATYESFKEWEYFTSLLGDLADDDDGLDYEFNKHGDIPIWSLMSTDSKCAAIEYVYKNRDTIELHSECVSNMVQATAYFMLHDFATSLIHSQDNSSSPEVAIFFDDLDFMTLAPISPSAVMVFPDSSTFKEELASKPKAKLKAKLKKKSKTKEK